MAVLLSSKGNYPQSKAYITTPQLQISEGGPEYNCPAIISGEA